MSFVKIFSNLNPFSIKQTFIDEWLKLYYIEIDSPKMFYNYYYYLAIYLSLMTFRMSIALIFRSNNVIGDRFSIYLGSWSTLVGGPPHYFELISLLWDLQCIFSFYTLFYRPRNQFSWIEMFGAINGFIQPKSIEIDTKLINK
jgi:hypothetical protein